jgi:hypothetical protein
MSIVRVQVTLAEDADSSQVSGDLRALGLKIFDQQPLSKFGVLVGDIEHTRVGQLRNVSGVEGVEEDQMKVVL